MKRRIFVSSPRDDHLDDRHNEHKRAIVRAIEALGYEAQVFGSAEEAKGLAARISWSPENADEVMRRCVGAAILGLPIWRGSELKKGTESKPVLLVTEYCHYEGALARTYGLPILAVLEEGVEERVFFNRYAGDSPIRLPMQAGPRWAEQATFRDFLQKWNDSLRERKDVFLAYSSKAGETAESIKGILKSIGATVLDWKDDSVGGGTILKQVEKAAKYTSGGVFLFTRDDILEGGEEAAPRDNAIFETGYFAHAKGHERVLIIREQGAKMPADLGGVIYETFADKSSTSGLKERVRKFINTAL